MRLNELKLKDAKLLNKYLGLERHELAVFSFANIYIWKNLFSIKWAVIDKALCIFFQDNIGAFLYLPPLAKNITVNTLNQSFDLLDKLNKNKEFSRIENCENNSLEDLTNLGFKVKEKSIDYVCLRERLENLSGTVFKHKRASLNFFIKHNTYSVVAYKENMKKDCLCLYQEWAKQRSQASSDVIYKAMIEDSLNSLEVFLSGFKKLNCQGIVVEINNTIKAFSFGYQLNKDTFCILYEITDLTVKGLAQFIFKEFCSRLKGFKYINIMDDSGLENLKKVKLSYQPVKLVPAFIVSR